MLKIENKVQIIFNLNKNIQKRTTNQISVYLIYARHAEFSLLKVQCKSVDKVESDVRNCEIRIIPSPIYLPNLTDRMNSELF